jgi:SAM-dependent methyltransferase
MIAQQSTQLTAEIDPERLHALLDRVVIDLGAIPSAALLVLGDRLGLFQALASDGPATSATLARATGTDERYVREWARALAAGGYLTFDLRDGTYRLSPEQAATLVPGGPVDVPTAAAMWLATAADLCGIENAFKTGAGIGWHEQGSHVWHGTDAFYRPGYQAHLIADWLPVLDGVTTVLAGGGTVADIGTGYGSAPLLIADAFPAARVTGFDYHPESVQHARRAAQAAGLGDRVHFDVADAAAFPGRDYDLVTMFDVLHDLGDPVAAARQVRQALTDDGTWLVVEPRAGDQVEQNLHPLGRLFYAASTLLCVPNARSQGGDGLGAQAGEAAVRTVAEAAGFTRFRRAAETPFNLVYEIRP